MTEVQRVNGEPFLCPPGTDRETGKEARPGAELLWRFVESAHQGLWAVDVAGRTIYANQSAADWLLCSLDDLYHSTIFDFLVPSQSERGRGDVERLLRGAVGGGELPLARRDGTMIPTRFSVTPVVDNGSVRGLLGVFDEDPRCKQVEDDLRRSDESRQAIAELTSDYVVCLDVVPGDRVECNWVSDAVGRIIGFSPEDLQAPDFASRFVHPNDGPIVDEWWRGLLQGESKTIEFRILTKAGESRTVRVFARPVWDQTQGRAVRVHCAGQDVTELRLAEQLLRGSDARFRAVYEGAAVGIALSDMHGRVLDSNPALQKLLGYSGDELRGKLFAEFTHPDDVALGLELYRELFAGKRDNYQMEKRYLHRNGTILWGRVTVSLVRLTRSEPPFAIGIVEDISERKQLEERASAAGGDEGG
ncbi:MAG: PAS domain S-box protein [Dehalococcoidales bacterium]|nr:PAS domain S-box protein [Dehalococcoidales bacterium]